MAKGQKRSGREAKKPKKDAVKPKPGGTTPFAQVPERGPKPSGKR